MALKGTAVTQGVTPLIASVSAWAPGAAVSVTWPNATVQTTGVVAVEPRPQVGQAFPRGRA